MLHQKNWTKLIIWIIAFESMGFLLGLITQANIQPWYTGLAKSSLTPPGPVFSIVWSILYALLALVGWILSNHKKEPHSQSIFYLYAGQMLMNWFWTPLFFGLHWLLLSLIWLIVLTTLNAAIIIKARNKQRAVALLLIPYFIWLLFASYLNMVIWYLN